MKRITLVLVSIILACSVALSVVGCAKNNDEIITGLLTEQFEKMKDPSSDFWQKDMKEALALMAAESIDPDDLASAWTAGFDYEIVSVTVDGDTAEAELKITCKQLNPAIDMAQTVLITDLVSPGMSSDDVQKAYGTEIVAQLKAAKPVTTEFTTTYKKEGKNWVETDAAKHSYENTLLGSALN